MSLAAFGGALQSVGDAGNQIAEGQLAAHRQKIADLFAALRLQQGQAQMAETEARTKKLGTPVPTSAEKMQQDLDALEKILGPLTPEQKKMYFGVLTPKPEPTDDDRIAQIEKVLQRKLSDPEKLQFFHLSPPKAATPAKPIQKQTYDPSGHLRYAALDPSTEEVIGWGPLVPEKEAFHYYTDTTDGSIHRIPTPTQKMVVPGEIQMSDKARKQWEETLHGMDTYATKPVKKSVAPTPKGTPTTGVHGDTIVGHTSPKDTVNLGPALKSASAGYTNWIGAQANAADKTPKGDLAIIYSAVRASVEGAGRMTNAEIDRQIKSGSYGDKWSRALEMAYNGTLPDDQRQENLNVIRNAWSAKAATAREAWKAQYPNREMPGYLQDDDSKVEKLGPGN